MWRILLSVCISVLFVGCDIIQPKPRETVTVFFEISDTTGIISNTFKVGESFDANLKIINSTDKELTYHRIRPNANYIIKQNDSVYVYSVQDCGFISFWEGTLMPGDTIRLSSWRGPQPLCIEERIILDPGYYSVYAYPLIGLENMPTIEPIGIEIITE